MIRLNTKTILLPPREDGTIVIVKQRKFSGIGETALILLGAYGGYKLIQKLFNKKDNKPKETE